MFSAQAQPAVSDGDLDDVARALRAKALRALFALVHAPEVANDHRYSFGFHAEHETS